ncbi:MAG: hypothetical protein ABI377_06650, partial [Devosia sp.]
IIDTKAKSKAHTTLPARPNSFASSEPILTGGIPRTMTISVEPNRKRALDIMMERARKAFKATQYQGEFQGFASMKQLFAVFTPKRWELIQKLQEIGPSSLRGLARALGRDVKRVHEDAAALIEEGIIERNEQNKLVVPFDTIHIDVQLKTPSAAA